MLYVQDPIIYKSGPWNHHGELPIDMILTSTPGSHIKALTKDVHLNQDIQHSKSTPERSHCENDRGSRDVVRIHCTAPNHSELGARDHGSTYKEISASKLKVLTKNLERVKNGRAHCVFINFRAVVP